MMMPVENPSVVREWVCLTAAGEIDHGWYVIDTHREWRIVAFHLPPTTVRTWRAADSIGR